MVMTMVDEELEYNKEVIDYLDKTVQLKKAEIRISKRLNEIVNYTDFLSELLEKAKFSKNFEEEHLKLLTNLEECKETENEVYTKNNQKQQLVSKKLADLMNIINYDNDITFDTQQKIVIQKLFELKSYIHTPGLHLFHDTSPNIISGFCINENQSVPIKAFEFNLKKLSEHHLIIK